MPISKVGGRLLIVAPLIVMEGSGRQISGGSTQASDLVPNKAVVVAFFRYADCCCFSRLSFGGGMESLLHLRVCLVYSDTFSIDRHCDSPFLNVFARSRFGYLSKPLIPVHLNRRVLFFARKYMVNPG